LFEEFFVCNEGSKMHYCNRCGMLAVIAIVLLAAFVVSGHR
jgi:hypothetical protein